MKTVADKDKVTLAKEWAARQKIHSVTNVGTFNAEAAQRALASVASRKRPSVSVRSFSGGKSSELLADFTGQQSSPNSDIYRDWSKMHFRAKDLAQNNPYVKRFITSMAINVIGPKGIQLQMDVRDPGGEVDEMANEEIERGWREFSSRYFTTDGRCTRELFENTVIKCLARDGEVIIRKVRGFRHNPHRFAVMLIDAAQLDYEYQVNLPNGNFVRMGVEFDHWNRPVAYHFREHHYGEWFPRPGTDRLKRQRIPADEIIHAFVPDYPGQWRGYPWIHAAMVQLRHLDAFKEAAIIAARVGASKMAFYKTPLGEGQEFTGDDMDEAGNLISETAVSYTHLTLPTKRIV